MKPVLTDRKKLPIQGHLDEIRSFLSRDRRLIIKAPPGAGKTTVVPLALLDEPWLGNQKIILLEPRRLAAVSCANHMARLSGEKIGKTVGYQIRMDRRSGPETRILVVTEGIFTRMIQADSGLEGIGLVIFDEFHERNIPSDLGLALAMETREVLRPDIGLLVMSATMDTDRLSKMLDNAPVVSSKGKSYPVKTIYFPHTTFFNRGRSLESHCMRVVFAALDQNQGDMLVFLPGAAEIRRFERLLRDASIPGVIPIPLYARLSAKEQAFAFRPAPKGQRKIIIATAIAETSITIDGIRIVVDSGLMRKPTFSPGSGMSRLETLPVSKASADQRRGRAGRTAPGICYRLWSEHENRNLKPFTKPEILSADLSGLILELAAWGVSDPDQLKWLDTPENQLVEKAKQLLILLGGLDTSGRITAHGKKMSTMGLHPRLAHMVLTSETLNMGATGCSLAALLMEKDILHLGRGENDPDIGLRMAVIESFLEKDKPEPFVRAADKKKVKKVIESGKKIAKDAGIQFNGPDSSFTGQLLAHAFPDRIAKKRNNQQHTYLTASGKGIFFSDGAGLSRHDYIVAANLDGNPTNAKIFMAAPYTRHLLETDFSDQIEKQDRVEWDNAVNAVKQKQVTRFSKLVVEEKFVPINDGKRAQQIIVEQVRKTGLKVLPWNEKLVRLKERICFLKDTGQYTQLPDVSDTALSDSLDRWLAPFLDGIYSFDGLKNLDMNGIFSSIVTWEDKKCVGRQAPSHMVVASGSKKRLEYADKTGILAAPVLKVRLQEMFGMLQTPVVADNTINVCVHLLSPAGRVVQITTDLESFWRHTYPEVKKDLKGRYPKHYWPDDPYTAKATRRLRPK